MSWEGTEQTVGLTWVNKDFFTVLGVTPSRGRFFAPEEGVVEAPLPVMVLSHAFWKRAFGADESVLGRSVMLEDESYTIIGVAEEGFVGLDLSRTDVFLPLPTFPATGQPGLGLAWYQWGGNYLRVVGRFAALESETALAELATSGYRTQPDIPRYNIDRTNVVLAGPLVEASGPGAQDAAVPISIRTAGVTALVLLIACANVASLLLVRATRRRREIAVRLALGISRRRLFSQLLTESLVLAGVAGLVACAIAIWGGSALRSLLVPSIEWAQPPVAWGMIGLVFAAAGVSGLLAGLVPGVLAARAPVNGALRSAMFEAWQQRFAPLKLLLVAQGALSIVLVVGAGLFVRSLGQLDALDLGYDTERLVRASTSARGDAANPEAIRLMADRVAGLPGVESVALASSLPMSGWSSTGVYVGGRDVPLSEPAPSFIEVGRDFFSVAGMDLLAGRTFEPGEMDVAVVDEMLAEIIAPGRSAIGECLRLRSADAECTRVVGVAENSRRSRIIEEQVPQFFRPLSDDRVEAVLVRFSGDWQPIAATARAELERSFDPALVRVDHMSESLSAQLRPWRLGAQLFGAFGALALIVTAVGIYGVISYTVSQRTHEMGVRIALGARVGDVLRLVVTDGLGVLAVGIALGIAAALALGRLIESLLYGVTPRDPVAMAAAAAVLVVAGLAASLVPAWRAAKVDPVRALAAE